MYPTVEIDGHIVTAKFSTLANEYYARIEINGTTQYLHKIEDGKAKMITSRSSSDNLIIQLKTLEDQGCKIKKQENPKFWEEIYVLAR